MLDSARREPPGALRSTLLASRRDEVGIATRSTSPAISPDGRRSLSPRREPRRRSALGSPWMPRRQPLPGTEGATSPFWSPDSRSIGFFAARKLKGVEAAGGPFRRSAMPTDRRGRHLERRRRRSCFAPAPSEAALGSSASGGAPVAGHAARRGRSHGPTAGPRFCRTAGTSSICPAREGPRTSTGRASSGSLDSRRATSAGQPAIERVFAPPGYLLFVREGNARSPSRSTATGWRSPATPARRRSSRPSLRGAVARHFRRVGDGAPRVPDGRRPRAEPADLVRPRRPGSSARWRSRRLIHAPPSRPTDERVVAGSRIDEGNARHLALSISSAGSRPGSRSSAAARIRPVWSPDGAPDRVPLETGRRRGDLYQQGDRRRRERKSRCFDRRSCARSADRLVAATGRSSSSTNPGPATRQDVCGPAAGRSDSRGRSPDARSTSSRPVLTRTAWVAYSRTSPDARGLRRSLSAGPARSGRSPTAGRQPGGARDGKAIFYYTPDGTAHGASTSTTGGDVRGSAPADALHDADEPPPRPIRRHAGRQAVPHVVAPRRSAFLVRSSDSSRTARRSLATPVVRRPPTVDLTTGARQALNGLAMTLSAGTRLGPYEILSPLGAGGMGEVYRAGTRGSSGPSRSRCCRDVSLVAGARQRFEREAKTISQLSPSPHLRALRRRARGETEYLVMEFLEGETLADRLRRAAAARAGAAYGDEIADALDSAHRQGIVHRDLKPGNVMLHEVGREAARLRSGARRAPDGVRTRPPRSPRCPRGDEPLTQEGTILGTFQYMAPEQLEGKEADARTDIFAFGAVLYEMATGQQAFAGKSQASLIAAIMKEEPPPMSRLQPMTPPGARPRRATCLAKDPEDRWQSAHDLAERAALDPRSAGSAAARPLDGSARPLAARMAAGSRPWSVAGPRRRSSRRCRAAAPVHRRRRTITRAACCLRPEYDSEPSDQSRVRWPSPPTAARWPSSARVATESQTPLGARPLDGRSRAEVLAGTEGATLPVLVAGQSSGSAFFAGGRLNDDRRLRRTTGGRCATRPRPRGRPGAGAASSCSPSRAGARSVAGLRERAATPAPATTLDSWRRRVASLARTSCPTAAHFLYIGPRAR